MENANNAAQPDQTDTHNSQLRLRRFVVRDILKFVTAINLSVHDLSVCLSRVYLSARLSV